MTINFMENIKKMMGWCPNASTLQTKRVRSMLPSYEDILSAEKRKDGTNHIEPGWGNKYRNIILIPFLLFFILAAFFALITPGYAGFFQFYLKETLLKEILTGIILAVFLSALHWRDLNRIKEGNVHSARKYIAGWIVIVSLFLYGSMSVTGMTLPFDFILHGVWSSLILYFFIMHPMVRYWEWKNRMTLYFVEEKPSRWRPVALPHQR